MARELAGAVMPPAGLRQSLHDWGTIVAALADTPRKRKRQGC